MKFMQAKAVLFLMLLFLSLSVIAAVKRVSGVPVIEYSEQRMGVNYRVTYYVYRYGGLYGGRYFVSTNFGEKKINCVLDDNDKCKGFDTPELALKGAIELSKVGSDVWDEGYSCKVDKVDFVVNCGYHGKGKDDTGGDGSTGSGTGSPVDDGNGNSNNDEKPPKPDPNQCGKTILGVWVPMPCDKVDDTETPADNSGSGNGSGGGSDGGSSGGSDSGSADGQGSDSNSDENNGAGGGNTDYVPPKEPECSTDPSKNMCGGDVVVSHGSNIPGFSTYSCRRPKGKYEYEYYNFWSVPILGYKSVEYCDGSAYVKSTDSSGNVTINIYNNYNTVAEVSEAANKAGNTDDIYDKFDRDRRNKEREKDKDGSSSNGGANAASQPNSSASGTNGAGASNGSVSGGANGGGSGGGNCEEGEDTLGCVPVGSQSDVDKAVDGAIDGLGDGDFGIGEKEISINSFKKGSDFIESGACPPPKTVTILMSTHEISYQPFCDAALKIRPFVIFMAMFVAFAIVYIAILNKD